MFDRPQVNPATERVSYDITCRCSPPKVLGKVTVLKNSPAPTRDQMGNPCCSDCAPKIKASKRR